MADLSRTLLSEQVLHLHRRRESGILAVSSGEAVKGIFLQAGHIVFASSTAEADKLGENLIRLGRISRADFAAAWQAAAAPRRRLGRALVEAGLLAEDELARLVAHQVQKIVLSTFTWTRGHAEFHPGEEAVPADLALDLSTHRLLLEGARVHPDLGRLERALGDLSRRLQVATRAPFDYSGIALAPAERAVLEGTADGLSLAEILATSMPRPLLVRAAYALLASGILMDPQRAAASDAAEPEHDSGTFRIAHAAPAPAAPGREAPSIRERILRLYEAVPRATHYELLGVEPDATADHIEQAWRRFEQEYQSQWKPLEADPRLASMVSTLRLRRREAHRVLGDPVRRATYDRSLGMPAR